MTRRPPFACAALSSLAMVLGACSPPAEEPAPAPAPAPAPVPAPLDAVAYACESGRTVSVRYPDAETATLTYEGRTLTLKSTAAAPAAETGARYAGEGLEWWTAVRDGQETAALRRAGPNAQVGAVVLERCARPAAGSGGTTPGTQPVLAPCKGDQLRLTSAGGDAGAGNRVAVLGVQNTGAQPCGLTGYPTVTLLDGQGKALGVRAEQNPGGYFRNGEPPSPVELRPQGRAYFDLAWSVIPHEGEGETTCPSASRIRITAPGDTTALTLTQPFTPCGGRVRVSPFRPTESDVAPPASV